jgi:hypothetical protein
MESSERHSEIKKARQKLTFLSVWLIVSFAACATVNVHIPPLFASAVSQDARSDIQRPSHEDTNSLLEAVERDIAGNKFGETESGLSAYLKDHPELTTILVMYSSGLIKSVHPSGNSRDHWN